MKSTNMLIILFGGIISFLLLQLIPNKANKKVQFGVLNRPDGIVCVYAKSSDGIGLTCNFNKKKKSEPPPNQQSTTI